MSPNLSIAEPPRILNSSSSSAMTHPFEDDEVLALQESGALRQVVGSQSMLSQELIQCNDDNNEEAYKTPVLSQDDSVMTPEKCGLLTQEAREEEEENVVRSSSHAVAHARNFRLEEEKKEEISQEANYRMSQESLALSETNFYSLIDAIEHVEKQREVYVEESSRREAATTTAAAVETGATEKKKKKKRSVASPSRTTKRSRRTSSPRRRRNNSSKTLAPPATPLPHMSTTSVTVDPNVAQSAAALAERAIHDDELAKKLLLSMALRRSSPRTAPKKLPVAGHIIKDGFTWAHYPPLEKVLKSNMAEYYHLSMSQCQSAEQQNFNNTLVERVREAAAKEGWAFDPLYFRLKDIRDRIRCYFKTHIQNAKKRLHTMLRNPSKRSNAVHLMQHYELIQATTSKNGETDE